MIQDTIEILLVEDDPGDQELARRALEDGQTDLVLKIVEHGEEALGASHARESDIKLTSAPATSSRRRRTRLARRRIRRSRRTRRTSRSMSRGTSCPCCGIAGGIRCCCSSGGTR